MKKYYPGGLTGFDKEGRPVWIDCVGYADVKGIDSVLIFGTYYS